MDINDSNVLLLPAEQYFKVLVIVLQDDRTALHETCRSPSEDEDGLEEIAQLLVDAGCDLNSKSSDLGEVSADIYMYVCGGQMLVIRLPEHIPT